MAGRAQVEKHLIRLVVIEMLRRKDAYVLVILMSVFMIGVLAMRLVGIDNPQTGTFLLNLGGSLAYFCAHLLTLLLAVRQVSLEMEERTIYPLLARPLTRGQFLRGKWLACTLSGSAIFLILWGTSWMTVPKLETYSSSTLLQFLILQPVSLGVLSGLALTLSLYTPRSVAILLSGAVFFLAPAGVNFLSGRLEGGALERLVHWVAAYIPDFGKLNLLTRYTDGIDPVAAGPFLGLLLYGGLLICLLLGLSGWRFKRMAL